MAGRPRLYANAAEKNRAYIEREAQRTVKVDRITFEQTEQDLRRLRRAVYDAQDRGDELALSLNTLMYSDMLLGLALYFETGAITPRPTQATKLKKQKASEATIRANQRSIQ